jgi:hypothetical protein
VDCGGVFAAPTVVQTEPPAQLSSPAVTADELELFYVRTDASVTPSATGFRHSIRLSKRDAFPVGEVLGDFDAKCAPGRRLGIDVTADGLRAYFTCHLDAEPTAPLWIAERGSRQVPFVVAADPVGTVGPSPNLAGDELTVFTSALLASMGPSTPQEFTRSSTADLFGTASSVPGLETATMTTLDLSSDGLFLYGASDGGLVRAPFKPSTQAFDMPETLIARTAERSYGSPELSQDCRTLYYVSVSADATDWAIVAAGR